MTAMSTPTESHLRQIAQHLGVPVSDFFDEPGMNLPPCVGAEADANTGELLGLWARIRDPRDRERCLNMLRSCAARTDSPMRLLPPQF